MAITMWCPVCGREFERYPSQIKEVNYCSHACRNKDTRTGRSPKIVNGYLMVPTADGWEYAHRIEMEKKLGRKLMRRERVYFIDGDRMNIDQSNLALEQPIKAGKKRWSKKYDRCVRCGRTDQRHSGRGMCVSCYMEWWKNRTGFRDKPKRSESPPR